MILADKIMTLRKKNGWSQEELAEKLNVSRQSVSKWESAQSVPELDKILQMSRIFGVTTDYLLKDDHREEEHIPESEAGTGGLRRVSMEEAVSFLALKEKTAGPVAFATLLCILSPVCLLMLGGLWEKGLLPLSENAASGLGILVLLLMVAAAVALFLLNGFKTAPYEYLDKEAIETEYGVDGMVRERQKAYRDRYVRGNVLGVCLCILAVCPIFAVHCFTEDDLWGVVAVCLTLALVAAGVVSFITVGIPWASMQKLLQEGDWSITGKRKQKAEGIIASVYWLSAVALYLGVSFMDSWDNTWVIWPVAGVLFAVVMVVADALMDRHFSAEKK